MSPATAPTRGGRSLRLPRLVPLDLASIEAVPFRFGSFLRYTRPVSAGALRDTYREILVTARRVAHSEADARDLVQDAIEIALGRGVEDWSSPERRAWLRGCENLQKRYLVHVAGYNLGLIMRLLVGAGTPRRLLAGAAAQLLALAAADGAVFIVLTIASDTETAMLVISFRPEPCD